LHHVIGKSISINGFLVSRLASNYEEEFYARVPTLIAEGKLRYAAASMTTAKAHAVCRYQEHRYHGLDKAGHVLVDVLSGKNQGKAVIIVAED
jgi:NADPH-dependent curcumin reductase CurA